MAYGLPWQDNSLSGFGGYSGYGAPIMMMPYREPTGLENLAGIGKTLAAAQYNLKGANLGPMKDLASQIGNLANAQYDSGNPLYQRLYEEERGAGMQDLSAAIAELTRQNRKLSVNGRTPLFNPERGGEQIFRQLTQGYQNVQNDARMRARQILSGGQGALTGAYGAYGTLAGAQDEQKKKKAFGFGNLADVLPLLGKLL